MWQLHAECRDEDPELFFPLGTTAAAVRQAEVAKQVCARCPVTEPCLADAVRNRWLEGVWGGTTEQERRRAGRRKAVECG